MEQKREKTNNTLEKEGLEAILKGEVNPLMYSESSPFGKMNGEEISNKHTLLQEIDALLHEGNGDPKSPDIELIYCEPYSVSFL